MALLIRARHIRIIKTFFFQKVFSFFQLDNEKKRRKRRSDYQSIDASFLVNGPGLAFFSSFDKMLFRRRWPSEKNIRQESGPIGQKVGLAKRYIQDQIKWNEKDWEAIERESLASWPWRLARTHLGRNSSPCVLRAKHLCDILYRLASYLAFYFYILSPVDNLIGWQDDRCAPDKQ